MIKCPNSVSVLVSREAAVTAYHEYVSSLLLYGLLLWGNSVRAFQVQKSVSLVHG